MADVDKAVGIIVQEVEKQLSLELEYASSSSSSRTNVTVEDRIDVSIFSSAGLPSVSAAISGKPQENALPHL